MCLMGTPFIYLPVMKVDNEWLCFSCGAARGPKGPAPLYHGVLWPFRAKREHRVR